MSLFLFVSGFFVVLTPLPLLYLFVAREPRSAIIAFTLAMATLFVVYRLILPGQGEAVHGMMLTLPMTALLLHFSPGAVQFLATSYYLFFAVIAFVLGKGISQKWKLTRWLGVPIGLGLLFAFLISLFSELSGAIPLVEGTRAYLLDTVTHVIDIQRRAGLAASPLDLLRERTDDIVGMALRLLPSVVFVFSLISVVLTGLLGRRIIGRKYLFRHLEQPTSFRLPDAAVWIVAGSGILFFIDAYVVSTPWLTILSLNMLVAAGALYFCQGLAVTAFWLQGIRIPMARAVAYLLLFVFLQVATMMMIGIGIADVWIDFRRRIRRQGGKSCK